MPRISVETRKRVCRLKESGLSLGKIRKRLFEEEIVVSKISLHKLWKKYLSTGAVVDRPRRTVTPKLTVDHYRFIGEAMASNDELTARRLREKLEDRWPGIIIGS